MKENSNLLDPKPKVLVDGLTALAAPNPPKPVDAAGAGVDVAAPNPPKAAGCVAAGVEAVFEPNRPPPAAGAGVPRVNENFGWVILYST